jgi:membrane protein YqaA with SNARE-associated domain
MTIFEKNVKMALESLGLVGLFLATFLSATILPFSSEAILLFFLTKGVDPTVCLSIATLGNSLGGASNYFIGRLGNPLWLKRIGVKENTIAKNEKWVIKYGSPIAFFSWIPFLGDPLLVVLGYFRSNPTFTFLWMVIGKFLRYLLMYLIYYYW